MRRLLPLPLLIALGCPAKKPPVPDEPSGRCEVSLEQLGLFGSVGTGARAKQVEDRTELIGGSFAQGRVGDWLLENDRLRVIIQGAGRVIGPSPYGGTIIDADLRRPPGEPGRDGFGKLAPLYAFGRTVNVTKVEVLEDGSRGGYAVVAASGTDAVDDYVNVNSVIDGYLGAGVKLVVDPNEPVSFTATTYYVLSPGETRVRALTAFCNGGHEGVITQMGDLIDQGGTIEYFNPTGCVSGLGANGCLVDPAGWVGFQGEGVAYGFRAYQYANPGVPASSAVLTIAGMTAVLAGGENQQGLLTWVDTAAQRRPGAFAVPAGGSRTYLRDFLVGKDLADVSGTLLALDGLPRTKLTVTVQSPLGAPAPSARVALQVAETGKQVSLAVADAEGLARFVAPPGNYKLSTGLEGRAVPPATPFSIPSTGDATLTLAQGAQRTLSVTVKDPFGKPLSAKVTVLCPGGPCSTTSADWRRFQAIEDLPATVAAIAYADGLGRATVPLPPGAYQVLVSRGPEYSGWPDTFPNLGQAVDVTTVDATVAATLAQVVDTSGWMSADLHVHAVGSPDSAVGDAIRAASFAAEGVDVLVSTDHDFVTDYAPVVGELGLATQMATMIGCEVTPFDYGHQQVYPIEKRDSPNGGAFDWAGGDGPSLRLDQLFKGFRERDPGVVVQMNHPRGSGGGSLTMLRVDTRTGASHADPALFRQEAHPQATAADTRLFSLDFDAFEVMNGLSASRAVLNDWMTFLSRGWVKTATGVSDTHTRFTHLGGYGRTWVRVGVDAPADFSPAAFAQALKARRAVFGNGPFVTLSARKADLTGVASGPTAAVGDTLSIAPATEQVELTVDVTAPEWMQFDSVELYTHTTGREALDGVANAAWPDSRILRKATYTANALPVEAVPNLNGFVARRVHVTERFLVTPAADTWYVAMVRSGSAARDLFPLAWDGIGCSGGLCTARSARAEALTNPVFIDGDGSGAYDTFPLAQGLSAPASRRAAHAPQPARRVPSEAEVEAMLGAVIRHEHPSP